tara:strand:+ start:48 stop:494 length:447 start_codon:yes stop_codon:yes gene_type:complete
VAVKYQQEVLSLCEREVEPLALLEWDESGSDTRGLNIDWESYFILEQQGKLKFFTARKEGLMIGYFLVVVVAPLTTKGELMGLYDAVYVHKDYRKSTVGKRLFKFVETCIKDDGISKVIASSSNKNPIGNFLSRMGYREVETKYEKEL